MASESNASSSKASPDGPARDGRAPESPVAITILDRRRLHREAMHVLVQSLDSAFRVSEADGVGELAEHLSAGNDPDIILLCLHSIDAHRQLEAVGDTCDVAAPRPVLVACDSNEDQFALAAIDRGAKGCLDSSVSGDTLVAAIRLVLTGEAYISEATLRGMTETRATTLDRGAEDSIDSTGLTPRQTEVLLLLCQGEPNKNIAYRLGMQETTVKVHVKGILRKLGVKNRTQAALRGRDMFENLRNKLPSHRFEELVGDAFDGLHDIGAVAATDDELAVLAAPSPAATDDQV